MGSAVFEKLKAVTWRGGVARLAEFTRTSLLVVPGALIALAILGSWLSLSLDERLEASPLTTAIFEAGPEGAWATLSAIATSVMTVGGVAFSMTIVVVQLASTQFSPRVVRSFLRSRIIQFVLGAYLGTFTYAILVLRRVSVKAGDVGDSERFVPAISVGVAVVLAIGCMALLVVFIHHVSRSVQVPQLVGGIVDEAIAAARHLYPEGIGDEAEDDSPPAPPAAHPPDAKEGADVVASSSGYLEYVDDEAFSSLPPRVVVRILMKTGDYVCEGDPVARLFPADAVDEAVCQQAARAFSVFSERTVRQDVGFAIQVIVDVAVRALSPGVNDPTTAVYCVNELGRVLSVLSSRRFPSDTRAVGDVTVIAPSPSFSDLVRSAYWQIVHYGREDLDVLSAVTAALRSLRRRRGVKSADVDDLLAMIDDAAEHASWPPSDKQHLRASLWGEASPRPAGSAGFIAW